MPRSFEEIRRKKIMNQGYFDIHCHILPGVDDGAGDMEETVRMLKLEYNDGVYNVIFTPHYVPGSKMEKNAERAERIKKVFSSVQMECRRLFPDMKVYLGNELYHKNDMLRELDEKRANTLAGSRYILIEFPTTILYKELKRAIQNYLFGGYLPVLAHMERYGCLYNDFDRIAELKNIGCLLQMNTGNFLEVPFSANKRFCMRAVKEGYVDFLGTDSHDSRIRKPDMGRAVRCLERKVSRNVLDEILYKNPLKLLEKAAGDT